MPSTVSLVFLSFVNLCTSVHHFAEKTLSSLNVDVLHPKRHDPDSHHRNDGNSAAAHKWGTENFLLTDYLADGEMERRISYKGVTAKETSVGNSRYVHIFFLKQK